MNRRLGTFTAWSGLVALAAAATALLLTGGSTTAQEPAPSPWADVRSFGAVGDGSNDDTPAFKRAVASGLPVLIPTAKSAFVLKETLRVGTGQVIAGVGVGKSVVKYLGTGEAFTTDPEANTKTRDVVFRDFTLVGTGKNNTNGIMLIRTSDPTVANVHIRDIGGIGIIIDGSERGNVSQAHYAYLSNVHVVGTNRIGVQMRAPGKDEGTNRHRFFFVRVSGSTDAAFDIGRQSSTSNYFGLSAENVQTAVRIAGRHNFFYGLQVETAAGHGVEFVKGAIGNKFIGTTMGKVSGDNWKGAEFNTPRRDSAKDPDFAR